MNVCKSVASFEKLSLIAISSTEVSTAPGSLLGASSVERSLALFWVATILLVKLIVALEEGMFSVDDGSSELFSVDIVLLNVSVVALAERASSVYGMTSVEVASLGFLSQGLGLMCVLVVVSEERVFLMDVMLPGLFFMLIDSLAVASEQGRSSAVVGSSVVILMGTGL